MLNRKLMASMIVAAEACEQSFGEQMDLYVQILDLAEGLLMARFRYRYPKSAIPMRSGRAMPPPSDPDTLTLHQMIVVIVLREGGALSAEYQTRFALRLLKTYSFDRLCDRCRAHASPEIRDLVPESWLHVEAATLPHA